MCFSNEHTSYFYDANDDVGSTRHTDLAPTIIIKLTKIKLQAFQGYMAKFKDFKALN